ncbi:hypothetical protein X011_25570 [Mycobacterium tuberculosis variant microti OV254]|nr:hypothetical protein X011_25570 [Mycobacterium tuberculosis variant microti OV254]BBX38909.1 hypothetical protein MSIM_03600 [Mycobacterium simiae]
MLTDARTGYANPGCYARVSNDCSEDLTLEHYISDDLLKSIAWDGKAVLVRGAAWLPSQTGKSVGVKSFSSRMLCGRHNRALSPLDHTATDYFRYFLEDQLDIFKFLGNDDRKSFARSFIMASGPYIELWMLKVLWGAIESKALTVDGRTAYRFRLGVPAEQLAEILWRGADWPGHWGMYVIQDPDHDQPVTPKAVRIRLESDGPEILGGYIQMAQFEYLIAFERPPVRNFFRPGGMAFRRVGFPAHSCKLTAFAWPELGHPIIDVVSGVPPQQDFTVPPNARSAAMHNQIMPGSLNLTSGAVVPLPPPNRYSGQ